MPLSIHKSVCSLTALIIAATFSYTSAYAETRVPNRNLTNEAKETAQAVVNVLDERIRNEFPNRLTEEERDTLPYEYGAQTLIGELFFLSPMTINAIKDRNLKNRALRIQRRIETRLPQLNGDIAIAQTHYDGLKAKTDALEKSGVDPDAAGASLAKANSEKLARLAAQIDDLKRDQEAFEKVQRMLTEGKSSEAARELNRAGTEHKTKFEQQLRELQSQERHLLAEMEGMNRTQSLPHSLTNGSEVDRAQLYAERTATHDKIVSMMVERKDLETEMKTVQRKIGFRQGFIGRSFRGTLKLVGVIGGVAVLVDRGTAYYVGYVLGRDPEGSPLLNFGAHVAPDINAKVRAAIQEISAEISTFSR